MKVKVLNVEYKQPQVSVCETNWKEVRKYLKEGYYIASRENGFCSLEKPSKILVTFEYEGKTIVTNFKGKLKKYYGKKKAKKLSEIFQKELEAGIIRIELDSEQHFTIVKC